MTDMGAFEGHSMLGAARVPDGTRIYAIGDIHGRLDLFERLIAMIRDDAQARPPAMVRIVLLGDLIDRGPDSAALVERCRTLATRTDRFVVLKGNHEAMMVHAVRGNFSAFALWMRHGGQAALRSWGVSDDMLSDELSPGMLAAARAAIPEPTLAWIDGLPLSLEIGDYLFVHAGIRPGVALGGQSPEDLLWIRGEFLDHPDAHARIVVHGHSIDDAGAVVRSNRIGIDTGAYRTGVLTVLGLECGERWLLSTSGTEAGPAPSRSLEQNVAEILGVPSATLLDARPAPRRRRTRTAGAAAIAATVAAAAVAWLVVAPPVRRPIAPAGERVRLAAADHLLRPAPASRIGPEADRADAAAAPHMTERHGDRVPRGADASNRGTSDRRLPQRASTLAADTMSRAHPAAKRAPPSAASTPRPAPVAPAEYASVTPAMARPDIRNTPPSPDFSSGTPNVRITTETALAKPQAVEVSDGAAVRAATDGARDAARTKQRLSKTLESIDAIRLLRRQ